MANRFFGDRVFTLEKNPVLIFGKVSIGGTGAATLSAVNSKGIVSVTRNDVGKYTFIFGTSATSRDTYNRLLNVRAVFDTSGASGNPPASPIVSIIANSINTAGTASVQVQFTDVDTPAATDPASGEILYIEFAFSNSTAI